MIYSNQDDTTADCSIKLSGTMRIAMTSGTMPTAGNLTVPKTSSTSAIGVTHSTPNRPRSDSRMDSQITPKS